MREFDHLPGSSEDRLVTLSLPEFNIEGAIRVFESYKPSHHDWLVWFRFDPFRITHGLQR
jgi:hypothetical protein